MASVLEVIKGLNQAAANAYDGYKNMDETVGLSREEGHPILDSRVIDGQSDRLGNRLSKTCCGG